MSMLALLAGGCGAVRGAQNARHAQTALRSLLRPKDGWRGARAVRSRQHALHLSIRGRASRTNRLASATCLAFSSCMTSQTSRNVSNGAECKKSSVFDRQMTSVLFVLSHGHLRILNDRSGAQVDGSFGIVVRS